MLFIQHLRAENLLNIWLFFFYRLQHNQAKTAESREMLAMQ